MKHAGICKKQAEAAVSLMASMGGDFDVLDEADIYLMAMGIDNSKYCHQAPAISQQVAL